MFLYIFSCVLVCVYYFTAPGTYFVLLRHYVILTLDERNAVCKTLRRRNGVGVAMIV